MSSEHRLPPEIQRDLRADVQIDAGDEEIPVGVREPRKVA